MNNNFEFSDFSNNSAYIINTITGKVVDTMYFDDFDVWTASGKNLSYYGLIY